MNRRRYLAALGTASVAGCLSDWDSTDRDETKTETSGSHASATPEHERDAESEYPSIGRPRQQVTPADERDPDPPEGGFPTLSVASETISRDRASGVAARVGVVGQYASDRVAQIQVDLLNAGDEPLGLEFGASPPFSSYRSDPTSNGARAFVVPEDKSHVGIIHVSDEHAASEDLSAPIDGCWKIENVGRDSIAKPGTIRPDHVLSASYSVYADDGNDECLPAGEYRFEETWSSPPDAATASQIDWGFTMTVDAP